VIKLKNILESIEEPTAERKSASWLTSGGMFIPVSNHHAYALRITGNDPNPESLLWKKGWMRVTYYSRGTLYVENHYMLPNEFQKAKLIDLVKELGFNELIYDNGKSRNTILWSKEDVLEENGNPKKNTYSWQKPDGIFIPIKYNHLDDAFILCGRIPGRDIDYLEERGWNRITHDKQYIICNNTHASPNDKQKKKLIELAIESGFKGIVWDAGEDAHIQYRIIWSKEDVLEEGEELTKGAKTYRFYVNTRRNPEIYDKYGNELELQFKEFFSKANKQQLLIAFYEGRLRRFYIKYVNTGYYNDPDGYWDDPVDIDEKGRDFLHKHVSQEDLVHMLNVYIKNIDKKGINDKYKSSKRQDRIYKTLVLKHGWKTIEGMSSFSGFNNMMEGMSAILLNRFKDFIVGTSMIEVSTLPTHYH